ncbi:Cd2+/Zn2+-exporting ATPase [Alteribacillus persepolensis]|uniref:Cd2+/Zn2+-exporting ATPase n=1 Tax=Alteribacillus persepolensis TaxID=568899 RepID=A0A1G8G2V4_9BACI|nr:heavy metal translocating P-type ATPase [Alteribacillus persepolensis]SDH88661.1 Cd2+/Zn2+-exporting ATPase [Alteribacillus persepolensis]
MALKHLWTLREWQFAIVSGGLILCAWLLENSTYSFAAAIVYAFAYMIGGYYKAKEGLYDLIHMKKLNVEILMILAAVGAAVIGYWAEGALLIFIFSVSGALETYTMNKSEKELSALMELKPQEALVLTDTGEVIRRVEDVKIQSIILVKPGERIPMDGIIVKGTSAIDESAISGESIPHTKSKNDEVFAGTVNGSSALRIEVTKHYEDTLFQRIISLVQSAKKEAPPSHQFIERFEGLYVKIVLAFTALMMVLPYYLFGWSWTETWYRAMVLLVVASPCALVASIMPATLSAISNGARKGILFKGGIHVEKLANMKAIAFDKTGTLTNGTPEVTDVFTRKDIDTNALIEAVAAIENQSTHPLAEAIVAYAEDRGITNLPSPEKLNEQSGFGVEAVWNQQTWRIGKKSFVCTDNTDFFAEETAVLTQEGKTIVYIADEHGPAAVLALQDTIRDESAPLMKQLKNAHIHFVMLTGDHESTASAIAKEAAIDDIAANCLPEDKLKKINELKEKYGHVAMVGDGMNDAPALAAADTSIAMGAGTDVALETSDIVLMKDDLQSLKQAITLSKRMNRIVRQNIVFSIAVIILLIVSNLAQQLTLPLGVIGHEGSTILVILNGLRLLRG